MIIANNLILVLNFNNKILKKIIIKTVFKKIYQ